MNKLDLIKKYKSYYTAKAKPELIELDEIIYLSIEGQGDPSGESFAERVSALYSVAYTIKFMCKSEGHDFGVPKLEGQWWFDESRYKNISMNDAPQKIPRKEWYYRLLIRMPDFVSPQHTKDAIEKVIDKKKLLLAKEVTLFNIPASKVLQMLHVGSFEKEPDKLKIMLEFIEAHQLTRNGLHHEVYLSDFRKTAPSKLKTILREPVK